MFFIKIISFLPLSFLYILSDLFTFLLIHLVRYRRKVIVENLKIAFPDYSDEEIDKTMRKFYKNFSDIIVETVKAYSISQEDLAKRVTITNVKLINSYLERQVPVIVMTPHLCNWEWLLLGNCVHLNYEVDAVYKRLKNPSFDLLMKKIRSRFGANLIEKDVLLRDIVRRKNIPRLIAMVSDQSPATSKNNEWFKFFNREIPFYSGAEKISKMTNYPVLFVAMQRVKRGYYEVTFSEIKSLDEREGRDVTKDYIQKVESAIVKNPSDWLWSHKRWKHARKF